MEHLPAGDTAPDFELPTVRGERKRLSDAAREGPVALAFYKRSCPTCQLTFPFLQKLFAALGSGRHPRIWGISQDELDATGEFASEHGLEFPLLVDEHPYPVSSAYEIRFVPTLFLVGPDMRIELADFGFSKPALREIAGRLAEAGGAPVPALFAADDNLPERRPG